MRVWHSKRLAGLNALRNLASRGVSDKSGVSAVEFAIFAPLLIMLMLGIGDVVPTVLARLQNSHATEEVGDVTAQFSEMETSDMVDVYSAAADVQGSLAGVTTTLRLTDVYSDGAGHAYVYWSCGEGGLPAYTARSAVTSTPTGSPLNWFIWVYNTTSGGYTLNGTNTSFIMVETSAVYTPPFEFIIKNPITMTDAAYFLPRQSSYIGFPWDGTATDVPPTPTSTTQAVSVTLSNGVVCSYAK